MTITESKFTDVLADGTSEWVALHSPNQVASVDCVDSEGESASWGSVNVTFLYSPDGKMKSALRDSSGDLITATTGRSVMIEAVGFVGISVNGISGQRVRLKVNN